MTIRLKAQRKAKKLDHVEITLPQPQDIIKLTPEVARSLRSCLDGILQGRLTECETEERPAWGQQDYEKTA